MSKCFSVVHYEYKMQMKRFATCGILLAATVIALLDNYPSAGNLARLEFLGEPAYFIYRTMSQDGMVMSFGILFLLSGRIPLDMKTGVKPVLMASPLNKVQYIFGKMFGGFLYTFTLLTVFLTLNVVIYFAATPFEVPMSRCLDPLIKTILICALPVGVFIGFISVALPAVIDMRVFYMLASVLFLINAGHIGSAVRVPCYLITSGGLVQLIWQHPGWPYISLIGAYMNLLFLVGGGLVSMICLFFKRRFWRAGS